MVMKMVTTKTLQDTDSVFLKLPDPNLPMEEVFRLGTEIAARATDLFPRPVKLELEKVRFESPNRSVRQ